MCSDLYLLDGFSLPFSPPLSFVRLLLYFPPHVRRSSFSVSASALPFDPYLCVCVNFCLPPPLSLYFYFNFFFPEEKKTKKNNNNNKSDPQTARLNGRSKPKILLCSEICSLK